VQRRPRALTRLRLADAARLLQQYKELDRAFMAPKRSRIHKLSTCRDAIAPDCVQIVAGLIADQGQWLAIDRPRP
jgi:hypothetical protein